MQAFPHRYEVVADAASAGTVRLGSAGLTALETAPPPEFGGPGGYWSPEALLVGAVADCFVLSFRAVARAMHVPWCGIHVDVQGMLDRVDGVTRFTHIRVAPQLTIEDETLAPLAHKALEKAERACLVTNSLNASFELVPQVIVASCEPAAVSAEIAAA